MSVLGTLNSDPIIKEQIELALTGDAKKQYTLKFLSDEADILDFLNYDLPEIVLINFSDPNIDVNKILTYIKDDKWLLNFGIIGLYSQKNFDEETILNKYQAVNLLALLNTYRIPSHLKKNIEIIEENYQIIFQRDFSQSLMESSSGSFTIENDLLAVPLYASLSATLLSQRGLINHDTKVHLQLAMSELIVNAIEHGNCGITYDEKTEKMEKGLSAVDLVAEKCQDPTIRDKRVDLQWEIQSDYSIFTISDEGAGFNVREYLQKLSSKDPYSLHGRGIQMASKHSHKLIYSEKGNRVKLVSNHDATVEREIPLGFSREKVVYVKPGDIVLKENEVGDYLYYIVSGKYTVYYNEMPVGDLSSKDIFMGEMSFLLNQRRSASVRAVTSGKLILLTRKTFINVIREYPHYGIFLSKLLAKRLVRSNDQNARLLEQAEKLQI